MRISFLSLIVALFVIPYGTFVHAQISTPSTFTANLSFGSSGTQVFALQKILNRDPDTRIPGIGPGSPGHETSYFGSLTKAAVVRFQAKYANEVLAPAGLTQGSGYVGSYTRAKLNALFALVTDTTSATPVVASTTDSRNPNLQNLDTFLAAIDTVGDEQGMTAAALAAAKEQVVKDVATTTNLRAAFENLVQNSSSQSAVNASVLEKVLATIENAFNAVFMSQHARAAIGLPFGGPLAFAFFCTCSANWLITIGPLPPTYVTLLSYYPGSQAYLSYNIPATRWLLGEYTGGGVCLVYAGYGCFPIPSQGLITPMVGSSGL